jgi:hypothetical protein
MRRLEPVTRCRDQAEEFTCRHCKTDYVIIWEQRACDNGSAECSICGNDLLQWQDSFIPIIRVKTRTREFFAEESEHLSKVQC